MNAAEQWIDISNKNDSVEAYFMAESGAFDLFILLGPTPDAAVKQYASLTGVAPLPQVSYKNNIMVQRVINILKLYILCLKNFNAVFL